LEIFFGAPANGFDREEPPVTRIITRTEAMQVVSTRKSAICEAMPGLITIKRLLENREKPTVSGVKPHKLQAAGRPTALSSHNAGCPPIDQSKTAIYRIRKKLFWWPSRVNDPVYCKPNYSIICKWWPYSPGFTDPG